jgi:hypothetical protein
MNVLSWIGAVGLLVVIGAIAERFGFPQVSYVLFGLVIIAAIFFGKW